MVSVSEATSIIESHPFTPGVEVIPISSSCHRVLAEEIKADRDFPPFNRVAMDGIAVSYAQFESGCRSFPIAGMAAAGEAQKELNNPESCLEVMTGAPLPIKTDTVIRYEDINIINGEALLLINDVAKGQNIHYQGQDASADQALLLPGTLLSPAEVALIASIGKSNVQVMTLPRTAIVSTGNELVDITDTPLPHQIRRSNSYALQNALSSLGCNSKLFHLPDQKDVILHELTSIVDQHELVILSGGVSKGKFDYVPEVLDELGILKHFHKVKQKPGKPFWFGSSGGKTIFALPGNPVSTFLCFYRYIKPWLWKSLGQVTTPEFAFLASDFMFKGNDMTYFLQVSIKNENGNLLAYPYPGGGSGDFANLKEVTGFMELPENKGMYLKNEFYPIYRFR